MLSVVVSPSVWGGLLVTFRPARHIILFLLPRIHYITGPAGKQ
jgi:hypothetical protein